MIPRLLLLSLALLTTLTHAEPPVSTAAQATLSEPAEPPPPVIAVDMQCVTLPQTLALPLIRKFRSDRPAEQKAARAELDQLLEKGTAELLGWPTISTRAGQRGTSEQIEEIRYPTEFETGAASLYLSDPEGNLTKLPSHVKGTDVQPAATAFETRNVGITLEAEPTVEQGLSSITVVFHAQHTRLKSIDRWTIEHEFTSEKKTEKTIQEQPRFTVLKAQNEITLESGEHKLAGVFKSPDGENMMELFVLSAERRSK